MLGMEGAEMRLPLLAPDQQPGGFGQGSAVGGVCSWYQAMPAFVWLKDN